MVRGAISIMPPGLVAVLVALAGACHPAHAGPMGATIALVPLPPLAPTPPPPRPGPDPPCTRGQVVEAPLHRANLTRAAADSWCRSTHACFGYSIKAAFATCSSTGSGGVYDTQFFDSWAASHHNSDPAWSTFTVPGPRPPKPPPAPPAPAPPLPYSAFNLSNTLGDGMVLQRAPQRAVVWGFAHPSITNVTAIFMGKPLLPAATVNTSTGVWRQILPATAASLVPTTLAFTGSDGSTQHLRNVLFGDVLLCSGQSNMQYTPKSMSGMNNATAEIASADAYADTMRFFTVGQQTSCGSAPGYFNCNEPRSERRGANARRGLRAGSPGPRPLRRYWARPPGTSLAPCAS